MAYVGPSKMALKKFRGSDDPFPFKNLLVVLPSSIFGKV
jgi:hypothetical protein